MPLSAGRIETGGKELWIKIEIVEVLADLEGGMKIGNLNLTHHPSNS
jgi:hypothetical protein